MLGLVGELNRAMRDACGDESRTSLLDLVLIRLEVRYDLRASEGEADSLILSSPTTSSGRCSDMSATNSVGRVSMGALPVIVP